jgi:TfoX/Sxy family transcriptional regulator of competence genes
MAYDEGLAERFRDALRDAQGIGEKKMFGGLCFMLGGHMMVGIVKDVLMARVGEAAQAEALSKRGARPMDFTGKPMKGYVFVDPIGIAEDRELESWIAMAHRFVEGLPSKDSKPLR